MVRRLLGFGGLFLETDDAPIPVYFDYAELPGSLRDGNLDGGDSDFRAGVNVLLEHLGVVHFIDVVGGKNQDILATHLGQAGAVLEDGVGGSKIPVITHALHRRNYLDVLTDFGR